MVLIYGIQSPITLRKVRLVLAHGEWLRRCCKLVVLRTLREVLGAEYLISTMNNGSKRILGCCILRVILLYAVSIYT